MDKATMNSFRSTSLVLILFSREFHCNSFLGWSQVWLFCYTDLSARAKERLIIEYKGKLDK